MKKNSAKENNEISKSRKKAFVFQFFLIIILILAALFIFLYPNFANSEKKVGLSKEASVVQRVAGLIEAPSNETPKIEKISSNQRSEIFGKVQGGDWILIYERSKKAVLFRASENRIIEIAPLLKKNAITPSPSSKKTYKLVVLNGTKSQGLAKKVGDELESSLDNVEVSSIGNATGDYKTSVVVNLSSSEKNVADDLAKAVKGKVEDLPSGEEKASNADFLILLGPQE